MVLSVVRVNINRRVAVSEVVTNLRTIYNERVAPETVSKIAVT